MLEILWSQDALIRHVQLALILYIRDKFSYSIQAKQRTAFPRESTSAGESITPLTYGSAMNV